jgi:predicted nucleic acid-binding protein
LSAWVVDASVAVKWYVEEPQARAARRLMADGVELSVPDLFFAEVGNALVKKCRRDELSASEARSIAALLDALPLEVVATQSLLQAGIAIALRQRCSMFDAIYVALAEELNVSLVTADQSLVNAMQGSLLAGRVCRLEDLGAV